MSQHNAADPQADNAPGTGPLRFVIVLMMLGAAASLLDGVQEVLAGGVPILAPLFTLLFLIAGVGLICRSCLGLKFAIVLTWLALIRSAIGLLLVSAVLLLPESRNEVQGAIGFLWFSLGFGLLTLLAQVVVLRILYNPNTLALMKESVSPLAASRI